MVCMLDELFAPPLSAEQVWPMVQTKTPVPAVVKSFHVDQDARELMSLVKIVPKQTLKLIPERSIFIYI